MFENVFFGKKVLITGHTGFKGAWLSLWLIKLGAKVVGVSIDIPTVPSMFASLNISDQLKDYRFDVRDFEQLNNIFNQEEFDFVFHLAAQPIVSESYRSPIETITTNILGTMNVLECLRLMNKRCVAVLITSDKSYDNLEQVWGYKESDSLGGKDIYSGSKGCAELVIKSYYHSFFKDINCPVKIGVGRAGNVIGGGDWAKDRIVVDCMKSWSERKKVEIRNPNATRPWQHVLEPLSGYMNLAMNLSKNNNLHGECFNFGPKSEQNASVKNLIIDLSKYWIINEIEQPYIIRNDSKFDEAGLLKLNCDKALFYLGWQSTLDYEQTIKFTAEWYFNYYNNSFNINEFTVNQINEYENFAKRQNISWIKSS
jgi:CDP-glucose 4,6-dehydratase